MRKITLLLLCLLTSSMAWSQSFNLLYHENFDATSGPDSVTNSVIPTTSSSAWNDTNFLSTSPSMSYHFKNQQANEIVTFETDAFSTLGNPYVLLSFNQIVKFFPTNRAYIEISVDNGVTWDTLDGRTYRGASPNFAQTRYFQEASHAVWSSGVTPNNNWWITEEFDLTGVASDTSVTPFTGYANVKLRFRAYATFIPGTGASAGWFVDDIEVIGNSCEVSPPQVSFNFTQVSGCYANKPQNGLEFDFSNSYPVGVVAFDTASFFDTGIDSVIAVYQKLSNGVWSANDTINMPRNTSGAAGEYKGFFTNILAGDTVRYYVVAFDLGCPNSTRVPTQLQGSYYTFYIKQASPAKCGQPNCGLAPTIIDASNPWVQDFEGNEWGVGTGTGNDPSVFTHRGTWPTFPDGYWTVSPTPSASAFGWSLRSGTTGGHPYTGPAGDHTPGQFGTGTYVYFESSTNSVFNNSSSFITPCIDLTKSTACLGLEFYYHMFGDDVSFIRVDIDTGADAPGQYWPIYGRINGPHLNNQNDPWQRAVISLEPFANKIIKIRFTAFDRTNPITKDRADMAIDDIKIFAPDPVDMMAIEQSYPVNGLCNYSTNQDVTISVQNNGCVSATDVPIAYQVIFNGSPQATIYRDTISNLSMPLGGDTLNHTFNAQAASNFTNPGTYQVKAWVEMPGDVDNSNDTVYGEVINVYNPINSFPYIEDFEDGVVGTQNINNSDLKFDDEFIPNFKWTVGEELTAADKTGPFSGFYWNGKYLYAEAGGTSSAGETYLRTVCVDIPATMTNPTLDFLYHDYAPDINRLEIQVSEEDEDIRTWTPITGASITPSSNYELDDWKLKRVDLSAYAGQSIKLRFTIKRKAGTNRTNFAIDNLTIYDLLSTDAGAFSILNPSKIGTFDTTLIPQFRIMNYGSSTLNNFTVHLDVTPLCGPNQNVTSSYSQSYTSQNIAPAQGGNVNFNSVNWDWDIGEYRLTVYTTASGDSYSFNDTISRNIIISGDPIAIQFDDNFDPCDYSANGFFAGGNGLLQWELGTPTFGFNGAHSAPNAWVTNLDGKFRIGTTERLLVPLLNEFDTISKAEVRFWHNIDFGSSSSSMAAGTVEYFTNGGYQTLGTVNSSVGTNWWSSIYATPSSPLFANGSSPGAPAFVNSTNGRWIRSTYPLDQFNYFTNDLIMRFIFKSDANMNPLNAGAGWAIDDFSLYVPPQNSAAPMKVRTVKNLPFPDVEQHFLITVRNTGGKVLDSFKVEVTVDGNSLGSAYFYEAKKLLYRADSILIPLGGGNYDTIWSPTETFQFKYPWPASTVTAGPHQVCVKTSRPNNKPDAYPFDDEYCRTIDVFDEIDLTSNSPDTSYCNDFEGTDPNLFKWFATNSITFDPDTPLAHSWRQGIPDTSQLPNAHSGNQVWMTDLKKNYREGDRSSLYTPIFIIDSNQTYVMDFWHWMQSEPLHDGGNIEFTEDGGLTWQHIGWAIQGKPWYNTQFVSALDQIKPGWSGDTEGWINSTLSMNFGASTKIIFRIRFGSDQDIEDKGWAIDDFCFFKTNSGAEYYFGEGENVLPEEEVIGLPTPNPASDQTQISAVFPSPTDVELRVVNTIGQLIEERSVNLTEGTHRFDFDTRSWRSGVYFVNIEYDGKMITRKLVIAK